MAAFQELMNEAITPGGSHSATPRSHTPAAASGMTEPERAAMAALNAEMAAAAAAAERSVSQKAESVSAYAERSVIKVCSCTYVDSSSLEMLCFRRCDWASCVAI